MRLVPQVPQVRSGAVLGDRDPCDGEVFLAFLHPQNGIMFSYQSPRFFWVPSVKHIKISRRRRGPSHLLQPGRRREGWPRKSRCWNVIAMRVIRSCAAASETRTRWLVEWQSWAAKKKEILRKFAIKLELEPKWSEIKEKLTQQWAEATEPKDEDRYQVLIGGETTAALSQLSVVLLQRLMRGRI